MAPRRPDRKSKKRQKAGISRAAGGDEGSSPAITPAVMLKAAEHHLSEGNAQDALILAKSAYDEFQKKGTGSTQEALPALTILGQINLELGEFQDAKTCFLRATEIDPDGSIDESLGGGPEKFLCLAQLSDEGGQDSVNWFDKGATSLKTHIQKLEDMRRRTEEQELALADFKKKLAMTLCSVAEVYMTDLSWEEDAEQRCESLVTEATMVAPDFAESWQTLANVRISQSRVDDAKAALTRSLELWKDLDPSDPLVPDFPSRVALARLLMEVGMENDAIEVLERLVSEDDHSVEVWYLGGWGLYVMGEKLKEKKNKTSEEEEEWKASWVSSRVWLNQCQHLYKLQEYEDERLGEHAKDLLAAIVKELGEAPEGEGDLEEEGWEDDEDDDSSDQDMKE